MASLSHRAPERRLTLVQIAISLGRATMRRARRTAAAVLPYLIGFGILDVIGRFTAPETQPQLLEASNKIKWVVQLVCAGDILRFLAINAWPIIMEAPFWGSVAVACAVGICWLLVSLASLLSISLWIGVGIFCIICTIGAYRLYFKTDVSRTEEDEPPKLEAFNSVKLKDESLKFRHDIFQQGPTKLTGLGSLKFEPVCSAEDAQRRRRFADLQDLRAKLSAKASSESHGRLQQLLHGDGDASHADMVREARSLAWACQALLMSSKYNEDLPSDALRELVEALRTLILECYPLEFPDKKARELLVKPLDEATTRATLIDVLLCSAMCLDWILSQAAIVINGGLLHFSTGSRCLTLNWGSSSKVSECLAERWFVHHTRKYLNELRDLPCGLEAIVEELQRRREQHQQRTAQLDAFRSGASFAPDAGNDPSAGMSPGAIDPNFGAHREPTASDDDDLPALLEIDELSDDEEPTTHKCDAKASPIKSRLPSSWQFWRRSPSTKVSRKTSGSCWPFCGSKKSDVVVLGGMPKVPDACANCSKPGVLSCCACGTTLCIECSGLDSKLIPGAKKKDKKKRPAFVCGRDRCPGGNKPGLRCFRCSLREGNDPSSDEVVVGRTNGVGCDKTALNCEGAVDYRKLLPPCSNEDCPYGGLGDAKTLNNNKELRKETFEPGDVLVEVDTNREARVVKAGDGLEVDVRFDDSEMTETCATYLRFDHKKVGDTLEPLDLPNLRCNRCGTRKGVAERHARFLVERTAMDELRRNEGVRGTQHFQRDRSTDHDWKKVDETDPERRNDFQKTADLYAKMVAAAEPLGEDEEDRVVEKLKVGRPLSEDLVRGVFPEIEEGSEKFEHLVLNIHNQLTGIRKAAETERPFVEGKRGPQAWQWFPSLEKLKDKISSRFTGLPLLVLLFMIPIFTAFLDDHFLLWRTATRHVKHDSRKQAAGMMGFFYMLLIALGLRDPTAWTVPLQLLGTFLVATDFIGEGTTRTEAAPTIRCTHYTTRFIAIGVRLRLVTMLYSLNVAAVCLVCISGAAIIAAGCQYGEQRTASAANGSTLVQEPDEKRQGDRIINRRAQGESYGIASALEKPNYCPDGGDIYTITVRRGLGTKHAFVSAGDDLPAGFETYDSIKFGIAGTDEEHFSACFKDVYENKIGVFLNGKPSGDGRAMLKNYRKFNGCNGSCGGHPFCLGKRDPSGTFDESRPHCGVRRGDWVEDIGRDIKSLPLEAKILSRANAGHLLPYTEGSYDVRTILGGDSSYAPHDQAARTLRDRIQSSLGQYAADARVLFMACFAPFLMPRIEAINADHAGARALAEAKDISGMRDRIAGVTVAIGEGATYLKQRLNEANGNWRAVVVAARRELATAAAPYLHQLPPETDPFARAVALKQLDAFVARALATRRASGAGTLTTAMQNVAVSQAPVPPSPGWIPYPHGRQHLASAPPPSPVRPRDPATWNPAVAAELDAIVARNAIAAEPTTPSGSDDDGDDYNVPGGAYGVTAAARRAANDTGRDGADKKRRARSRPDDAPGA